MLAQNIKKIFEELDEDAVRILTTMTSKGRMTAYEVWRESKQKGEEIPKRTVYGKLHWLSSQDRGYIVKVWKEPFKKRLLKVYYDVTLKGLLAALTDEKLSFNGIFLERIREKLHIPMEYEKTVKPIVSIWAYLQSRIPKIERGKIDVGSIFMLVLGYFLGSAGIGIFSLLGRELSLPRITEFKQKFEITDEEHQTLKRFISVVLAFHFPESLELHKRTLCFATRMAPAPYLSDCIEIFQDAGIRVFWTTSESFDSLTSQDNLLWLYGHRDIADFVSKGDYKSLNEYLGKFVSNLHPSWLLICIRRELDGICSVKGTECSFTSPLDCNIVREKAETFRNFLDMTTKKLRDKLDLPEEKYSSTN